MSQNDTTRISAANGHVPNKNALKPREGVKGYVPPKTSVKPPKKNK